jgi:hypothetical protein
LPIDLGSRRSMISGTSLNRWAARGAEVVAERAAHELGFPVGDAERQVLPVGRAPRLCPLVGGGDRDVRLQRIGGRVASGRRARVRGGRPRAAPG